MQDEVQRASNEEKLTDEISALKTKIDILQSIQSEYIQSSHINQDNSMLIIRLKKNLRFVNLLSYHNNAHTYNNLTTITR